MRGRRRLGGVVLGLVLLVAGATAGRAEAYTVGVENLDYLPAYGVRDGAYAGYARDLLDAFAAAEGIDFDYRPLPVPRLYATFLAGQLDFKFPDNANWAAARREGLSIAYSAPLARYVDATLVRPERRGQPVATLGTVSGFTPWAWMARIQSGQVRVLENANFTALVRQALAGRIDAAYANVSVVNRQLDQVLGDPGGLVLDPGQPHDASAYHLSTLHHPEVVGRLDTWMLANADWVAQLKQRHAVEKGFDDLD
ncbi:substrate-binding periplasmic protein [Roseospirillum parvum]|uniref:ABC-type amino acid transport substrate-binding protein n=1 Tax=Roseospirillum parvum TaxID=83401 RepID=A0A1G7WMY8_9PROT|nr:transporter substrate-binding domain-containing protein [Roseospirillum parvum]SDG73331.1 ABC-type amino acid transport substrate-binding protein [Roseospirillum parvum]